MTTQSGHKSDGIESAAGAQAWLESKQEQMVKVLIELASQNSGSNWELFTPDE